MTSFGFIITTWLAMVVVLSTAEKDTPYSEDLETNSDTVQNRELVTIQPCSSQDSFRCDSEESQCVPFSHVCNGQPDCHNGYDESVEQCGCLPTEFQCNATVCIDLLQRCDGTVDCEDGLDEEDCETYICPETHIKCDNHKCVPRDKMCDFIDDCGDGSDENICKRRACFSTEIKCNNSKCTSASHLCDGINDCLDGSDEDQSQCEKHFKCPIGFYVTKSVLCDGWVDCFFTHADELDCGKCEENQYTCPNGQCISEAHVCDGTCDCLHCQDEDSCEKLACVKDERFLCRPVPSIPNGRCIDKDRVCDEYNDCQNTARGRDEYYCTAANNCSEFQEEWNKEFFMCLEGRCLPEESRCDGFADCVDGEDEEGCGDLPTCKTSEFRCHSGQCVPKSKRCDSNFDCNDRSDEDNCREFRCAANQKKCDSGQCVAREKWCDFRRDCLDGSDERGCANRRSTCLPSQFQCQSGQCIDQDMVCYAGKGAKGCLDKSHLINCTHQQCPAGRFKCRQSYCIDESQVCDGDIDCQYTKWDEMDCYFRCPYQSKVCVCKDDCMNCEAKGLENVPGLHEEEHLSKLYFAGNRLVLMTSTFSSCVFDKVTYLDLSNNSLEEIPGEMFSSMWRLTHLILNHNNLSHLHADLFKGLASLKQISLYENRIATIQRDSFLPLINLRALDLSRQQLTNISRNSFKGLRRVLTLNLSLNRISFVESGAFVGLDELISLDLSKNRIKALPPRIFLGLPKLKHLDVSSNLISRVSGGILRPLKSLENLDMSMNSFSELPDGIFFNIPKLKRLVTDAYKFCCLASGKIQCLPEPNEFSSCKDLMSNHVLRISIWVLGMLALVGNLVVIIWRLRDFRGGRVHSFLITNLAIGDFLMGVYLIIIATVDTHYRGYYIIHDEQWRQSDLCRFAGFVSTFSSELSVLTLTTITLDRLICILFPLKRPSLGLKQAAVVMVFIWSFVFFIAILPLFGLGYFKDFYGRSGVCLALHVTPDRPSGWEYSVGVFLVLNLASFLLIATSYLWMFSVAKKTRSAVRTPEIRNDNAMARRMTIIVMTDFCCWVPIIVLGFVSLAGLRADNQVYAWIAVFVLPLNSATNPILYTLSTAPFLGKIRKRATRFRKSFINSITAETKNSYVEDRTIHSYCERKSPYRQMELVRLRSLNNSSLTFYSRDQLTEA